MALSDGSETIEEFELIKECVAAFTASRTKQELFALANKHRLLLAPVATTADVAASEQLAARSYWDDIDGQRYPGHWMKPEPTDGSADRVPAIGEHTAAVLASQRTPAVFAPEAPTRCERPLEGLKVLDFMWAVAGPTFSRILADAGATVIRVESSVRLDACRTFLPFINNDPGPENSALFNNMNAGKLGITLNPGTPAGLEVAHDLIQWADVVCEAYTPRAMRSWGLDYDNVREINPTVVMLSTCLFGQSGPLANFAGYGNLSGAMTWRRCRSATDSNDGQSSRPPSPPGRANSMKQRWNGSARTPAWLRTVCRTVPSWQSTPRSPIGVTGLRFPTRRMARRSSRRPGSPCRAAECGQRSPLPLSENTSTRS